MARRRTPDERHAILDQIEANGWTWARASKKTGIPGGTLRSWAKRRRDGDDVATGGGVATGESKQPSEAAKTGKAARLLSDLSPDQERAVWMLIEGRTFTSIAAELGHHRNLISEWTRDPIFAAALSAVRAERHSAALSALTSVAQAQIEVHGQASELARLLVAEALQRLRDGPPVDAEGSVLDSWQRATDSLIARALEAARVLNASPVMASAGYPKTDRVEHAGEVDVSLDSVEDLFRDLEAGAEVARRLRVVEGGKK